MNRIKPGVVFAVFLSIVLAAIVPVFAQPSAASAMISSADLMADVKVLRRAYEELHPGLYRYNTREQMDANFATLEREFSRDRTLAESYLAFSVFLAKLKCGHSYANFYNQPKPIVDALFKGQNRLPFYFRWLDGKMIVVRSFADAPQLARGTEIVSISGVAAKTVLDKLMTVARADGSNDAKRVSYLEVLGNDKYEAFDIFYPLFFPQNSIKIALTVRPFGSKKTASLVVDALTYEHRLSSMPLAADSTKSDDKIFDLSYLDERTAKLTMPNWALYDSKWDWKKFIDESVDELIAKNIPNLIVDIRSNEGGIDAGNALAARLIDKTLYQSRSKRLVRYRKIPADLKSYLDTWDRSFDDWGASAVEDRTDGFFTLTKYDDDAIGTAIYPSGTRYKGRVFLLVGAANSSATFSFAAFMKANRLATLVGQPTGGNQRGINGGAFYFLRLPNSKIEMDLPLIGTFPDAQATDAGIEPDIHVKPTASDISKGIDAEIETVKKLINNQSPKRKASNRSPRWKTSPVPAKDQSKLISLTLLRAELR